MTYLWQREHLEALFAAEDTSEILAGLSEPLGLAGAQLPAYGVPGPGCCRECLRPPVYSLGVCVYCSALAQARAEDLCKHGLESALCRSPDLRERNLGRAVVMLLLLTLAMLAILWAAGVIT